MKKRLLWSIVGILFAILLSSAITANNSRLAAKSAKEYAENCMLALCYNEFSENAFSDLDYEQWSGMIEELIEKDIDDLEGNWLKLTDDERQSLRDIEYQVFRQGKYFVDDAVKTEDGYDIPITIEPLLLFKDSPSIFSKGFAEYASSYKGGLVDPDELSHVIYSLFKDTMEKNIKNPSYGSPVNYTLHYVELEKGKYGAKENTGIEIQELLVDKEFKISFNDVSEERFIYRVEAIINAIENNIYDEKTDVVDMIQSFILHWKMMDGYDELKGSFYESVGRDNWGMTEEQSLRYLEWLIKINQLSKVECQEAFKDSDDYVVQVSVQYSDTDNYINNIGEELKAEYNAKDLSGITSEEQFNRVYYDDFLEKLDSNLDKTTFCDPEIHEFRFSQDEDGEFYMIEEDLLKLSEMLYALSE